MTASTDVGKDGEVIVECGLDAPPEKVWRALSVPELAADWLGAAHGKADASGQSFEIVDVVPCSRMVYRWFDRSAARPVESLVTVEIEPHGAGSTWFRLTHTPPSIKPVAANANRPMAMAA